MSRSSWKSLFAHPEFIIQQEYRKQINQAENVVLFNRATVITRHMIGFNLDIYNGIRFFPLTITTDMIGHRIGEFAPTRKKPIAKKKKK